MDATVNIEHEAQRLYEKLANVGFNEGYCKMIAPLTLEINELKRRKNAVILAHSYQTADILYGVADVVGDSYQLSKKAQESDADLIVFCGVRFMAETAKVLNPSKTVILPAAEAGCSLADSITAKDVRALKDRHPGVPVVVYVNTSAEVKAEADACCTSANAVKVIEGFPGDEIIFLPDKLMAANLQKVVSKKLITWHGTCIVHEDFQPGTIARFRALYPGVKVLAHSECSPLVVEKSDMVGGTGDMIRYVQETQAPAYMLVTECGLSDRMRAELPEKEFLGMCGLCPYMKMNTLPLVLKALKNPSSHDIIEVDEAIRVGAEKSLLRMFELTEPRRAHSDMTPAL
ncbi:MAG TPA: quinolinate synthase NadA [Candidatus Gracilibacteria bacterium]|nr:quinolinate synthase NadA [Candidatus Gracilibacteria bacterium]